MSDISIDDVNKWLIQHGKSPIFTSTVDGMVLRIDALLDGTLSSAANLAPLVFNLGYLMHQVSQDVGKGQATYSAPLLTNPSFVNGNDIGVNVSIFFQGYTESTYGGEAIAPVVDVSSEVGNWFVSSINGDDTNTGIEANNPLQSLTALQAKGIQDGDVIRLEYGSVWNEEFYARGKNDLTISAYGNNQLPKPMIDGSIKVETSSISATGTANEYIHSFTPLSSVRGGRNREKLCMWQGKRRMYRADNRADVATIPGSFWYDGPITHDTPMDVYFHAYASADPVLLDLDISITNRSYNLIAGNRTTLKNLRLQKGFNKDTADVGFDSVVYSCDLFYGPQHCLVIRSGTIRDSRLCRYGGDVVFYTADPSALSGLIENCELIGGIPEEGLYEDKSSSLLFSHGAPATDHYQNLTVRNCVSDFISTPLSLKANNAVIESSIFRQTSRISLRGNSTAQHEMKGNVVMFDSKGKNLLVPNEIGTNISNITSTGGIAFEGNRIWAAQNEDVRRGFLYLEDAQAGANLIFRHNTISLALNARQKGILALNPTVSVVERNVFHNLDTVSYNFNATATADFTSNHNVFDEDGEFKLNDVTYRRLANWLADTSQDADSVDTNAQIADPANEDFTSNAPEVTALQAGYQFY